MGKNGNNAPAGLPRKPNGQIDRSKLDPSLRDIPDDQLEILFANQLQADEERKQYLSDEEIEQFAEGQGSEEEQLQLTPYLYVYEKDIENGVVQKDLHGKPFFRRRKGMEHIPENLLTKGSAQELTAYLEQNDARLTPQEKQYLSARIDALMEADELEKSAKKALYNGETPKKTEPTVEQDGFLSLPGIVGEYQSSQNGCWSVSLSLMLKSRGVELTQEQIRAYRPGFGGADGVEANGTTSLNMNADEFSSPYEHADLVLKVLPNTAMKTLHLNAVNEEQLTLNGRPLTPAERESARKQLRNVYGKTIADTIREGIRTHKSPLSMSLDGHFVTVTGISADGRTIRYEDSLQGKEKQYVSTRTMTMDQLLDGYVFDQITEDPLTKLPTVKKPGVGISLSWLQDIETPEYEKRAEQPPVLLSDAPDALKTDDNGTVRFDGDHDGVTVLADGAANGLLAGRTVSADRKLDQTTLGGSLKGKRLELFGGAFTVGSVDTYLPKQVYCKHDPKLLWAVNAQSIPREARPVKPPQPLQRREQNVPRAVQGNPLDNAKAYIESLRREMQRLPRSQPTPDQIVKQEELVQKVFAARIGLKTEISKVNSLDKPRDKKAERKALAAMADNTAMRRWLREMPYDKLRAMMLADHGGRMEKDFKKFLLRQVEIPENTPERFMPTAKQRCETLKAAIEARSFAARPEDERMTILTELLAARGAANVSRHTGENLGAKVSAAALEKKRQALNHPLMQRAIQKTAAEHPELLARRGHGGAFEQEVIETYRAHCCEWARKETGRYELPPISDPRYALSYRSATAGAQTIRNADRADFMQRIALCIALRNEAARGSAKGGDAIRDPVMVNRLARRLAAAPAFRKLCDTGYPAIQDLNSVLQKGGKDVEEKLDADKVKALLNAERKRVLSERDGKSVTEEKQIAPQPTL